MIAGLTHLPNPTRLDDKYSEPDVRCDKSLDLLGSDPNIEREQRAKQQYFTYWLLRDLQG
jgi:hypothetical protein